MHGSGKTTFMEHLAALARDEPGTQVFSFDMARYDLGAGFRDDHGAGASAAVLWETFIRSREVMRLLAGPPFPEFRHFTEVCRFQSQLAEEFLLIIAAVHEPRLRQVLDAVAVTSTFDTPLLATLVRAAGGAQTEAGEAIARLVALRLLRNAPERKAGRFRMQEFIRLSLAARLRTYHPDRWTRLHRAAADHYFDRLRRWEDGIYTTYSSWYRFEDPDRQEDKREWLRHSGLLTDDHAIARARITLVFLEAFWWAGCYVPFPFNRRLLEDWSRTSETWEWTHTAHQQRIGESASPDEQLLDALTYLLDNYPVTHLKPPGAPWDGIRSRLRLIRRICGIGQRHTRPLSAAEKEGLKRADAFITVFLAHTRRFRDPSDRLADGYYARAAASLAELGDDWSVAWLCFERADLELEREEPEQALAMLTDAARRTRELALSTAAEGDEPDWDHELLANLHRLRGDLHWRAGEREAAAAQYSRALAHAYLYQGDPNPPDAYSQQFYLEMATRAAARMAERPESEAVALLAVLRRAGQAGPSRAM
ncbi:hypothetical protein [Spongiactinospora sp. 9N601]|uniref:hypothetical protein n=1 Tax=Spongiactinospora sp. 9N601 TaxID=3375149 RepID=UPI0037A018FD